MNGTDSLLSLTAALDAAAVPYMIVGSYSSNFYGIPRSTRDADLVIHLPSSGWAALPSLLPDGIHIERQMGFEMVTSTRKELLRVRDSLFEIELFHLSEDPHDQSRFARRRQIEIFPGSTVWLPTAEDVIIQKLRWSSRAKRSKDFADAVAVMQVQGKALDWLYIEHCAGCTIPSTFSPKPKSKPLPRGRIDRPRRNRPGPPGSHAQRDLRNFSQNSWPKRPPGRRKSSITISISKPWRISAASGRFPATSGSSDTNNDGVSLLLAYALGLDPSQNLSTTLPKPVLTASGLTLTFHGNTAGINYLIETSADLATWQATGTTLTSPDGSGLRTATLPVGTAARFMRLAASY